MSAWCGLDLWVHSVLLVVAGFGPSAYVLSKGALVGSTFVSLLGGSAYLVLGLLVLYGLLVCSLLVRWAAGRWAARSSVSLLESVCLVMLIALLPLLASLR